VYEDGKFSVLDGPCAEAKELVAGYWMVHTKDKAELIEWAKRAPIPEGRIEIRPLYEASDFPVDERERPEGWREQEERLRAETAARAPKRKEGTRRFIIFVKANEHTESGVLPSHETLAQMGTLMAEMAEKGVFLAGDGLKPSKTGTRVQFSSGKTLVTDGPFTESKEMIAGFMTIQAHSKDEAVEWARRWLAIHVRALAAKQACMEVREVIEVDDIPVRPEEKPDGWRAQEQRMREALGP
jgi:hypothetical protein